MNCMISRNSPLIGRWFFRRLARKTGERAVLGDTDAIRNLCDIVTGTDPGDPCERDAALNALRSLRTAPAINAFCNEVLKRGDESLARCAVECAYVPADRTAKALFFFGTGQREKFESLGSDHCSLLAQGYAAAEKNVRETIRNAAKKFEMQAGFSTALRKQSHIHGVESWSYEEWDIIITGMIMSEEWEELWQQIFSCPVPLAISALYAMKISGWKPATDEESILNELCRALPAAWEYPLPDYAPIRTITADNGQTMRCAFSRNGDYIATGTSTGLVFVWNALSGRLFRTFMAGTGTITVLAITPDSRYVVGGTGSSGLHCWDTGSGLLAGEHERSEEGTPAFAVTHNGGFMVTGDESGRITLIRLQDGSTEWTVQLSGGPISSFAVSADDSTLAAVTGSSLCFINIADGSGNVIPASGDDVRSISLDQKGETGIVIGKCASAIVETRSGNRIRTFTGQTGKVTISAISLDGSHFATVNESQVLQIWDRDQPAPLRSIPIYRRHATCCEFSSDANLFVIGFDDGTIRVIQAGKAKPVWELKAHKRAVTSVTLSPEGNRLLSAGWDGATRLWDIPSREIVQTLLRRSGEVTSLAIIEDTAIIVAGYSDGTVRQFTDSGNLILTSDMYTTEVGAIAVNGKGTIVACAGRDCTLHLWNPADGALVSVLEGFSTTMRCLAFVPGTGYLLAGGWDGKMRCWGPAEGKPVRVWAGHTSNVTGCAVAPGGKKFASCSNDGSVRIWNMDDTKAVAVIRDTKGEVSVIAISPDGEILAAAGVDDTIRFYRLPDGKPVWSIAAFSGKATSLAFTRDSRMLAAGYDSGLLAFISCEERKIAHSFSAHAGSITGIVMTPDGGTMVTGGRDGMVKLWKLPWKKFLSETAISDISRVSGYQSAAPPGKTEEQWNFLRLMIAGRFRHEIELCAGLCEAGMYDIQIVG